MSAKQKKQETKLISTEMDYLKEKLKLPQKARISGKNLTIDIDNYQNGKQTIGTEWPRNRMDQCRLSKRILEMRYIHICTKETEAD